MDLSRYKAVGDPDEDRPPTKKEERQQAETESGADYVKDLVAKWPPLTDEAAQKIARLLNIGGPRPPGHTQMRWRLKLFCGHVIERTQHTDHPTYTSWHGPCPECGRDPVAVIASRPLGLVADLPVPPPKPKTSSTTLERRLAKAKAEVERLERELGEVSDPTERR